jgi:diaminopimelate decarboxylase
MGLVYRNGELHFGEAELFPLLSLAAGRTQPFYLYDLDAMRVRVRALKAALPRLEVHYAMKANASERILSTFREESVGVDVVSGGELRRALACGFQPEDIIFSGVGKSRAELELAITLGIKQINVESPQELRRIVELARNLVKKPKIAFRINPDVDAETHPYITTGFRENKFGMDESFLPELRTILKEAGNLVELCGLTLHIGSQLQNLAPLEDAIRKTLPLFHALRSEGYPLRTFDVGGGLGIPYQEEHSIPSKDLQLLEGYGAMLRRLFSDFTGTVLCEPGRILVGSSGTLVGEVQYVKEAPQRNFLILNTGVHHLLRPALYQAYHRIMPLLQHKDRAEKSYDVVGPICESSDVLGRDRRMPEVRQGEFLAIADAGAYGYTMASLYNEHPMPDQFYWEKGRLS